MTGKRSKHFGSELWVDFVNGKLPVEQRQTMQKHLDENCGKCSKDAAIWSRVRAAASRESGYEVPEGVARHVRSVFGLLTQHEQKKPSFEVPRLVFDSLWQPALAGVRAASTNMPRQVLYKAGEVAVEIRLEPEVRSERVNLAGQVSSSARQGEGLSEILVLIRSKERVLAETRTNRFGEFQLSFLPDDGLRISFVVVDGKELSIPLSGRGVSLFDRN